MLKKCNFLFFLLLIISLFGFSQQNSIQHFSAANGLSSSSINEITQDNYGYLWLATNMGLVRFDGSQFQKYQIHSSTKANTIFFKNNTLFIAHENGFYAYQNNQFTFLGKEKVTKMVSFDSKLILGTQQGVYELKSNYLQPLQMGVKIDYESIKDILITKKGSYVATKKSLWFLDKLQKPNKKEVILKDEIVAVLKVNHKVLAATKNNGIKEIRDNKIVSTIYTDQNVNSIKQINDELWITTSGNGIEVFDAFKLTFKRKINKYNSNISNEISSVFRDIQNTIWIGSFHRGLYKYQQNSKTIDDKNVKINIKNIAVNYKSIAFNNQKINLLPDENNISIRYKTVDLNTPKNIQYQYQLNGKFSPWSSKNSIEFANLKPGEYQFSVQSKNGHNLSNTATFNFHIDRPIYRKAWFIILCTSLLFFAIAFFIDIYLRQIKKKNKIEIENLKNENHLLSLEQKALQLQMNPHFIFNVLNGIKALGNLGKHKELNTTISQFSVLLRSVLNNSRTEKITLKEEIDSLRNYLELEQKMGSKNFAYSIHIDLKTENAEEILIPPMLVQPLLENSIQHGFLTYIKNPSLTISVEVKYQFLHFIIKDNGIGFYQSQKKKTNNHQSVALSVTKERIKNLSHKSNFKIEEIIKNNQIKGTKVTFRIPLRTDY